MSRASPHAPPKLIVSRPAEDVHPASSRPTLASRRRSKTESSALKGRSDALEWIDVDDENHQPRRRKRSSTTTKRSRDSSASKSRRSTESEVSRFFPSLTRILESSNESRPGTSGSDSRKQREGSVTHRRRHREDIRRPVKHRVGGVSRRQESSFKVNPSLLSVLTSLTGNSDSSSSTTITQQSYDRQSGDSGREVRRSPETEKSNKKPGEPNVFDYMDAASVEDGHDGASIYSSSSSSSHYEHSDAGSSELPETPSSHSTFPSPTATRQSSLTGSVAELRRKYDAQYASPATSQVSARSGSHSPESITRDLKKLTKVRDVAEDSNEATTGASQYSETRHDDKKRSSSISSRSSRASRRDEERLRYQEEAMRHHQARSQHGQHFIDPVYGQHRSHSASSNGSAGSARAYAQYMAMQQYQYPSPPVPMAYPIPPQATNGNVAHPDRPPVPDAPDLSQRTLAGYEQLAVELASEDSPVKPMYRKFEYLNHRILLHLQDELSEMEEQLRTLDEIIAQMEPSGQRAPASRRGDAFAGSEIHHQRTALLGRIFLKTEQYSRAMKSSRDVEKDAQSPQKDEVETYREYLKSKTPIHEVETRFLADHNETDLISLRLQPAPKPQTEDAAITTKHAALTCLPVALMLPLLLFALIPSLAGRLVVTALIAMGVFMVAATTRIWECLEMREWAVCGAAYVLVMAAVAGCVPVHGS